MHFNENIGKWCESAKITEESEVTQEDFTEDSQDERVSFTIKEDNKLKRDILTEVMDNIIADVELV